MKSDLMTDHIRSALTPWKWKTSLPFKYLPLCCEKASTRGHHRRAVTPTCMLSGSLAGITYFQILATDNYVSNKNKPFLPGMLKLNHLSVSIYSRHRALQSCTQHVLFEIMCQMAVNYPLFLTGSPPLGIHHKSTGLAVLFSCWSFASLCLRVHLTMYVCPEGT